MKTSEEIKFRKAQKKVEGIKNFYRHLFVYCMLSLFLFIGRDYIIQFFENKLVDTNFIKWLDWNIIIFVFFLGIGLLFRAWKVFQYNLSFIENWEKRQMEEFMNE